MYGDGFSIIDEVATFMRPHISMCVQISFFRHMDINTVTALFECSNTRQYMPGERLFGNNTVCNRIYIIASGSFNVYQHTSPVGEPSSVLSPCSYFGVSFPPSRTMAISITIAITIVTTIAITITICPSSSPMQLCFLHRIASSPTQCY